MGARQVRLKGRAAALLDIVGLFGAAVEPAQEPAAPSATAHHLYTYFGKPIFPQALVGNYKLV